ncbi:OmpA family protein [Flavobacterium sp. ACAM 123]|jgi:outer membrane protein OmpA-like peptidoglycan-associated protein|uniref:OmpA family protein n=1 Tax=Flavobacterium sp. ACAM 123 TaxID=1189620 RepID=UPI0002F9FC46|nr:OmpA family protein [Flavobacterium sp. ACAM 123]
MKTTAIIIALFTLFCTTGQSQEKKESTILISEDNLISLINKIKETRDAILLANNNSRQNDGSMKTINDKSKEKITVQDYQISAIYAKLQTLEYDIKQLNTAMNSGQKQTTNKESVTVITPPSSVTNTVSSLPNGSYKESNRFTQEIVALEKKIIALKEEAKEQSFLQNKVENDNRPNNNYNELLRLLNSKNNSKDTLVIEQKELSDYAELMEKFDSFKSEVYFDNNSKIIKENQSKTLDQIITILKSTEKIDVYLKGFASNIGNPLYNQNLSVQRTETVKKYLVKQGIHPARILTQYHGIDYSETKDELARRVELSFIIRK